MQRALVDEANGLMLLLDVDHIIGYFWHEKRQRQATFLLDFYIIRRSDMRV